MNQVPYPFAPVTEAVAEVIFAAPLSDEQVGQCSKRLKKFFPLEQEQFVHAMKFELDKAKIVKAGPSELPPVRHLRLSSEDSSSIAIIAPNRISASRLPPYTKFDELRTDFSKLWEETHKVSGYRKIERVGLRYVNRLDLPFSKGKLVNHEDYLNIYILIPDEFDLVNNYSLSFEIPLPEIGGKGSVRSRPIEPALIDRASFLLDIDVYLDENLPQKREDVFSLLERMRAVKNRMFEAFITDKARDLFHGV